MISFGDASTFLTYESGFIKIFGDDPQVLAYHTGLYNIAYKLIDSSHRTQENLFKLIVGCFIADNANLLKPAPKRTYTSSKNPPKPFIQSIDNIGTVRIGFTQPILLPTFERFAEFKES